MIFYYVRHGDPIYDPDSLTEKGKAQVKALAKRFARLGLDEIYCSTSNRAIKTAEPTCKILNKNMTVLDWTNEGYTWEDFSVKYDGNTKRWCYQYPKYLNMFNASSILCLGNEWYNAPCFKEDFFRRGVERINKNVDELFESLGFKHERENNRYKVVKKGEKRVALFAHEGTGLAVLSSVLDIPYPIIATRFALGHSMVTVIEFDESEEYAIPKILQWSNDSHLYKEDILSGYNNGIEV